MGKYFKISIALVIALFIGVFISYHKSVPKEIAYACSLSGGACGTCPCGGSCKTWPDGTKEACCNACPQPTQPGFPTQPPPQNTKPPPTQPPPNYTPPPNSTPDPEPTSTAYCVPNGTACSSQFSCCGDCCVDENLCPGQLGKCIAAAPCIPNKLDCRYGTCTAVCGWNCVDCSGGYDCNPNLPGDQTECCCKDGCSSEGSACTAPPATTPLPTVPPGCGVSGKFTFVGARPPKADFYGWRQNPPGQNQTTFREAADANGNWSQAITCGSKVFGNCDVSSGWTKSPSGPYARNVDNLQGWITNWNCTITAQPTPTGARIRGAIYTEKANNGKLNDNESCFDGLAISLFRSGAGIVKTVTSGNCNPPGNITNFNFGKVRNAYYKVQWPAFLGYELMHCGDLVRPSNTADLVNDYFYCKKTNPLFEPQLRRWTGSTGQWENVDGNWMFINGVDRDAFIPMVTVSAPSPTPTATIAPPTPTATTVPPGPWRQILGGDTYQGVVAPPPIPPPYVNKFYLKDLSGAGLDKSAGVIMAQGGNITVSPLDYDSQTHWKVSAPATFANLPSFASYKQSLLSKPNRDCGINNLSVAGSGCTGSGEIYYHHGAGSYTLAASSFTDARIYLIDGDLNITGNVTMGAGGAVAFIVSGNVNIQNNTTSAYGVYVVDRDFNVTSGAGNFILFGSLFANRLLESRTFVNANQPTYMYEYNPEYLLRLLPQLGRAQVSWQEVAP